MSSWTGSISTSDANAWNCSTNMSFEAALGRVDGFDDDEAQSECDEGSEVLVRFLATERNALEALELAHKLLDTGAGAIERLREEGRPGLGRCLYGITGQRPRSRAAARLPLLSYPLSPTTARGVMSGPRSSRTSNCGLSLA